jgi:hypothetical protein
MIISIYTHAHITSHVIFSHEKVCDAYASRTAWLGARMSLYFLLFNFSNRK